MALLSQPQTGLVRIKSALVLPPESEVIFPVTISHCKNTLVLLEPLNCQQSFLVAKMLIKVDDTGDAFVRLLNPLNKNIRLSHHSVVAKACSVEMEQDSVMALFKENAHSIPSSINRDSKGLDVTVQTPGRSAGCSQTVDIDLSDTDLTKAQKTELLSLLDDYSDRFSMDLSNIGRCNIYGCELPTTGTLQPIKAFYHYPPLKADEIDRYQIS